MKINKADNYSFGQIFVSQQMKQKIATAIKTDHSGRKPTKKTFVRNWNRCLDTKQFDLLIKDDGKVFLLDKGGQFIMEEKLLEEPIWNVDTALKRILLFEDANPLTINHKTTKYD